MSSSGVNNVDTFCCASEAMKSLASRIGQLARSECATVLLTGPTGTGKEVLARQFYLSRYTDGQPCLAVNCAGLTSGLLESELFGHVRGAFTGADRDKTGLFEAAGKGMVLLDEISELPLELQGRLLRALQERRLRRVGGIEERPFHATLVATSNQDLLAMSRQGRFRADLYYRLAVVPLRVPALASPQRRQEILPLAEYFLANCRLLPDHRIAGFSPLACRRLMDHSWPGNVRELRNVVDRAVLAESTDMIGPDSIVFDGDEEAGLAPAGRCDEEFSLAAAEKNLILRVLKTTGGHRSRSASLLGISRATLCAKLKQYGSPLPAGEPEAQEAWQGEPCLR